jgi:hypothetical protein
MDSRNATDSGAAHIVENLADMKAFSLGGAIPHASYLKEDGCFATASTSLAREHAESRRAARRRV